MTKRSSSVAAAMLAGALAALSSGCAFGPRLPPGVVEVQLVTLNDFHGNLEPSKYVWDSVRNGEARTVMAGVVRVELAGLVGARRLAAALLLAQQLDAAGVEFVIADGARAQSQ